MRKTEDKRGRSYWDIVGELPGQINVSITHKLERRGFHLHKKKTDHWFCAGGRFLVVLHHPDTDKWDRIEMKEGDYLEIKPNIWHAYQNIRPHNSILVYYETNKSGVDRSDDFEMELDVYPLWMKKAE